MSNKKKKTIADSIIDGTYGKKDTIANSIINGTYTPTSNNTSNKNSTSTSGKKTLNTGLKLISNIGTGALKGAEKFSEILSTGIGYTASGVQSLWDKEGAQKTKDFWKNVTKTNVIDDTIGQAVDNVYGKNSYIGQGNKVLDMADSIIEGTAEMIPSLILGNQAVNAVSKLGLTAKTATAVEKANLATKTADKLTKASQTAKNVAKATNLATKATAATNTANKLNKVAKLYTTADNTVKKVASLAPFITQATGSSINQALNNGASYNEAVQYGATSGLVEGIIESMSGGIGGTVSNKLVSKVLSKPSINKALNNFVSSNIGKFVTKTGDVALDAIGEGFEELISGVINPYIERMTYNEKAELANSEELMEEFVSGALGSLLMKGGNALVNSNSNKTNEVQNNETQNNVLPTANQNVQVTPNISKEGLQTNTTTDYINNINKANQLPTTKQENSEHAELPNNSNFEKANNSTNDIEQIKKDVENFSKQVDAVKNNTFPKNDMLTLGKTPKILQELGLPDFPITITQKHLDTIMNESGKYKGANYHNLGEEIVKKLPEALNNPLDILKSNTKDDSIVLTTDLSDKQDRTIIASIKIDGKGNVNDIRINTNVMTSAYGKDNYDKFMQDNIKNGNLLYDIDQGITKKIDKKTVGERLQLPIRDSLDSSVKQQLPNDTIAINNIIPQNENYASTSKKILNPAEISNLTNEDVSTTPKISNKSYKTDEKSESKFYNNLMFKTGMLDNNMKNLIKSEKDIKYYEGVTNAQSLKQAYDRLNKDGARETTRWLTKDLSGDVSISASEVAEGWILLKQYQDAGDYESAVNVAKKMRDMATKSGQALQAYSIQARLTPEGMFQYAQSELQEAFEKFSKNKTKEWIEEHKSDFDLKPEETQAIIDKVKEAQELPNNSREKIEKLAEIKKIMTDKLPPERGAGIKSWMRISMLFNPKTQVRNILGNTVIAPVNAVSDFVSSMADNALSKKTGIRTTGNTNLVNYAKGFKKGLFDSYSDFKKGINTRDISGDRFEIGKGKSFKDKGIGKALNKVDSLLNFMLDAGDRPFYEATFTNSINNQLVLNNTDVVTQDMIDIATKEALNRTWQDNNDYTKFVLSVRNTLNKVNVKGYGLGDVLIPFAKTPANLTKAIVEYSPAGVVKTLVDGNNVRKAIARGDLTAQEQHEFVQKLGKATAGSMLYILGYALAKLGIVSGESDEDKDVANFVKNNLGISNYSIKIGDKSFTYDWAQPIAAPFSMMANLVNKSNKEANLLEKITSTLNVPLNNILEQSFMQSINTVLTNNDGPADGILEAISELPSRSIPTLMKQIVDMTDSTQRTTYEKDKPVQTAINKVIAKLPIASKQLTPVTDTLGNDIKKHGGETNELMYAFNTFLNPANVNSNQQNEASKEIYEVYKQTGDKTIFPRQASYTQTIDGNNITLSSQERYEYQKNSGQYVDKVVKKLLKSDTYNKLSYTEKAEILSEITSDSNEIAKEKLAKEKDLKYTRSNSDIEVDDLISKGLEYGNAYIYKTQINSIKGTKNSDGKTVSGSTQGNKAKYIMNMNTSNTQKDKLLSLLNDSEKAKNVTVSDLNKIDKSSYSTFFGLSATEDSKGNSQRDKYLMLRDLDIECSELDKYITQIGKITSDKNEEGKSVSGSRKKKIVNYINSLNLSIPQKAILIRQEYSNFNDYNNQIVEYVSELNISYEEKVNIIEQLDMTVGSDGRVYWK